MMFIIKFDLNVFYFLNPLPSLPPGGKEWQLFPLGGNKKGGI